MFNADGVTKRPKLEFAEIAPAKVKNTDSPVVSRPEDGTEMIEEDPETITLNVNTLKGDAAAKQCSSTENETSECESNETATNPDDDEAEIGDDTEVKSDVINDIENPKENNDEEDVDGEKERVLPFKDLVVFIWKTWKIIVGRCN